MIRIDGGWRVDLLTFAVGVAVAATFGSQPTPSAGRASAVVAPVPLQGAVTPSPAMGPAR